MLNAKIVNKKLEGEQMYFNKTTVRIQSPI